MFLVTLAIGFFSLPKVYRANFPNQLLEEKDPNLETFSQNLNEVKNALNYLDQKREITPFTTSENSKKDDQEERPTPKLTNLKITVLNGSNIVGAATNLKNQLKETLAESAAEISIANTEATAITTMKAKTYIPEEIRQSVYRILKTSSPEVNQEVLSNNSSDDLVIILGENLKE